MNVFRQNNSFFKTRIWRSGFIYEALIIPPPAKEFYGEVGVILRADVHAPTHTIDNIPVRIMAKVQGRHDLIDPFDLEYGM